MTEKQIYYLLLLVLTIVTSCTSNKFITGKYKNNISPFGLSSYEVNFKENDSCTFKISTHLSGSVELVGTYQIRKNNLYIRFIEPRNTIINDSILEALTWTEKKAFESYELKKEDGIAYHYKYLIDANKLFVYRIDNGKLVKKVDHYDDENGRHKTKYYLKKVTE
ncbi:hypothetical protein [Robertkochia aurantiaca]|uniref:hypothetical protein n=1 Tax=Robertkochia aurantiaca TaxID=2873700 RepID=UPI001CCB4EE1|nr:hypothetical protein [Robertkochia sp. 3YJGBD-33]